MAKTATTEAVNPLSDFDFNDNAEFFGIKTDNNTLDDTIKEIKSKNVVTEEGAKAKEKATEIKEVAGDNDDDELADEEFFADSEKPKPVSKKTTKKEEIEEVVDEDEVVDEEAKIKPTKSKKEEAEVEEVEVTGKKGKSSSKKEEEEDEEEDDAKFYTTLAGELKEKGILQLVEIPKDKELSEEEFFELQNQELDLRIDEAMEGLVEGLDDDAKRFLKFKKDGGNTHEFFQIYANTLGINTLDDSDPAQVDKVIRYYLTTVEGLEGDEFDDRLKYIKEGGKSKTFATKWFDKIRADEDEEKETLQKAVEANKKSRIEKAKAFNDELTEIALKTDAVGAFTFTKADQKKIIATITKPTVKIGKDKYVPEFNAKLGKVLSGKTETDKKNLLVLAYLIDNNFDTKGLTATTTTKVVKEVKSTLKAVKSGGVKAHSSNRGEKRELSDYF